MIEGIAEIIVRFSGGFWSWFEITRSCEWRLLQKLYLKIYYLYQKKYCAFIAHNALFASEPCFPHNLNGIFIAGGAKIGLNCVIFHQVTLGANSLPFSRTVGAPTIGDNCYIGAGAMIIGSVTIGSNCRIGANCVVTTDVPANCVVVFERCRIITQDAPMINRYYRWSPEGPVYFDRGTWILETDAAIIDNVSKGV